MSNLWKELQLLLPASPLVIGTIIVLHSDGRMMVELPGGGLLPVQGGGSLGQRVFVRDGQIVGEAPDLSFVEIAI